MPKTLNTPPTQKQAQLWGYINKFEQKNNYSPTLDNMAKHFNVSIPSIFQRVDYLEKKGYVIRQKGIKYSIRVVRNMRDLAQNNIIEKVITESSTNKKEKGAEKFAQKGNPQYEFFLGDSLQVLPQLTRKYSTIYLDPPFNSNRHYTYSAFDENFGFSDKWLEGEYEKWVEEMIYKCKQVLRKDGTLFFHISAELSLTPHLILQKHFKKVEQIFWKKAHGKNTVKNKLGAVVDIIFKASDGNSKFNLVHIPLDAYYFENSYKNKDAIGYYALGSIKHDKTRSGHFYRYEKDGIVYEAPYGWKINREKLETLLKQNRIHFAKPKSGSNRAMLYKKLYKHECRGKPLSNLWDDIAYITRTTKDERLYPTQKPFDLLKRLVEISSSKGDWVLDPVAGSGTTGAAAISIGRHVTLIDVSKESEKIIKKRLQVIS